MSIPIGTVLEGRVTGITNFGAFVELGTGVTGLVHISEVADTFVRDVKDFVKENDTVRVKVISAKDGKIGLSIKQANPDYVPPENRPSFRSGPRGSYRNRLDSSFEDKMARFLKDSEDRLSDLHRNVESKRGGRGSRYSR